jgi:hypothetical protein
MRKNCETCIFMKGGRVQGMKCHFNPPQVNLGMASSGQLAVMSHFPPVSEKVVCGQHRLSVRDQRFYNSVENDKDRGEDEK